MTFPLKPMLSVCLVALALGASTGCEEPCASDGRAPGSTCVIELVTSAGEQRSFRLHVPTGYRDGVAAPLVLNFPGLQESAERHEERVSEMSVKADAEGFIVVYPDALAGLVEEWRTGPFAEPELVFVDEMLDFVSATLDVDPDRVYATGISNGGGMVHTLACRMSDRFAAYAPVAAANFFPDAECAPQGPQPMLFFFGDRDPLVPWPNGWPFVVQAPLELAEDWAERNGAGGVVEEPGPVTSRWYWPHPTTTRGDVTLLLGHGVSHVWPKQRLNGYDANDLIWDFFVANAR